MISRVARVLFFPMAPGTGLAHVGACVAVARELERRGHETVLAYGGGRPEIVASWTTRVEPVGEIPADRAAGDTVAGWYAEPGSLERLVRGDVELIRRVRPDVAVVDMRLSATIACELTGVPDLSLMHFLRVAGHSFPSGKLPEVTPLGRLCPCVLSNSGPPTRMLTSAKRLCAVLWDVPTSDAISANVNRPHRWAITISRSASGSSPSASTAAYAASC